MNAPTFPHLNRRRLLLAAGGGFAVATALAQGLRHALAATPAPLQAPDGRPAMRGRAPTIFVGHGSPLNVVQDNRFTQALKAWGYRLGLPRAILVVSAHWLTEDGTRASAHPRPQTIHDFGGFPAALYEMHYPAPGAPELARRALAAAGPRPLALDAERGFDHGVWTVLWHLYPAADVPVFQVSIDIAQPAAHHLAMGRMLRSLRDEGVLILGSGNVVHNLQRTNRQLPESPHGATPWAQEFDLRVKQALDSGNHGALLAYERLSPGALTAVPFPDHYYPLLYAQGAAHQDEAPRHVFEGFQSGTLSMRCVQWG